MWTLRPKFYTEFRTESIKQSDLAWGAGLETNASFGVILKITMIMFSEHFPRLVSSLNVPGSLQQKQDSIVVYKIDMFVYKTRYESLTSIPFGGLLVFGNI